MTRRRRSARTRRAARAVDDAEGKGPGGARENAFVVAARGGDEADEASASTRPRHDWAASACGWRFTLIRVKRGEGLICAVCAWGGSPGGGPRETRGGETFRTTIRGRRPRTARRPPRGASSFGGRSLCSGIWSRRPSRRRRSSRRAPAEDGVEFLSRRNVTRGVETPRVHFTSATMSDPAIHTCTWKTIEITQPSARSV